MVECVNIHNVISFIHHGLFKSGRVLLLWDYFEDPLIEGRALGDTTDQIIEHMHSYINRILTKSFYKLKDTSSEKASSKQHQGILKINAFAVKIKKNEV